MASELRTGDRFILKTEETATNTGKIARGIPATNKRYTVRGASVGPLDAHGKIKEERWSGADLSSSHSLDSPKRLERTEAFWQRTISEDCCVRPVTDSGGWRCNSDGATRSHRTSSKRNLLCLNSDILWVCPARSTHERARELNPQERSSEPYATTSSTGSALSSHRMSAVSRCRHSAPLAWEWSAISRAQCRHSAMNCPRLRSGRKVWLPGSAKVPDTAQIVTLGRTLDHLTDSMLLYAAYVATRARDRIRNPPRNGDSGATPESLIDGVHSSTAILGRVLEGMKDDERAFHPSGLADRTGWIGMACTELLAHGYDIGLEGGRAPRGPSDLAYRVVERVFPWAPDEGDGWARLLWATGRKQLGARPTQSADWWWHSAPLSEWDGTVHLRDARPQW